MKKQYSKRRNRASKRRTRTQRRRKQRTQRRHRQKRGGAMPMAQPLVDLQRNISTIIGSLKDAINGSTGRWSNVFYVADQNMGKVMFSASNNETNQQAMNQFVQNLQQKTQEINADLASRTDPVVSINDLQALDVTREEVMAMTNAVPVYRGIIEEELEDWDSGIQKLIVFSI